MQWFAMPTNGAASFSWRPNKEIGWQTVRGCNAEHANGLAALLRIGKSLMDLPMPEQRVERVLQAIAGLQEGGDEIERISKVGQMPVPELIDAALECSRRLQGETP